MHQRRLISSMESGRYRFYRDYVRFFDSATECQFFLRKIVLNMLQQSAPGLNICVT